MIDFGQKVDLCQRIRDVLINYPEGALLKVELPLVLYRHHGGSQSERPPRRELAEHTRFPVVVPSATPGYHAAYTARHLDAAGLVVKKGRWARGPMSRVGKRGGGSPVGRRRAVVCCRLLQQICIFPA